MGPRDSRKYSAPFSIPAPQTLQVLGSRARVNLSVLAASYLFISP